MTLETSALHRSIANMAFRVGTARERKQRMEATHRLAPTEQQIQIDFDADVLPTPVWEQVQVDFREVIITNHAYANTPYDKPHVSLGHEIESGPPVSISHHVRSWVQDTHGNYTGCVLELGVWDPAVPTTNTPQRVSGRIHLRVQGDSIPIDDGVGTDLDG